VIHWAVKEAAAAATLAEKEVFPFKSENFKRNFF
jgi:hypothetical protein